MKGLPPRHTCPLCQAPHWPERERKRMKEHFSRCAHCKEPCCEDYQVKDAVWEKTGLGFHDGVLHLCCLEKLLGRHLTIRDFETHNERVNAVLRFGYAMGRRAARISR